MEKTRNGFSGKLGFVLAAAGSAVGLGNIWRFPYLAAKYGGGMFLLVYILLAITFGFTLMVAEIAKNCPEDYFTLIMRRMMMRISETSLKKPSIVSSCCHSLDKVYPEDIHQNVTIKNNKFINSGAIILNSTTGINIEENQFIDSWSENIEELITLKNCKDVTINNDIINKLE